MDTNRIKDFWEKQSGRHCYQLLVILHYGLSPLSLGYEIYASSSLPEATVTSTRPTEREETGRMQGTDVSCQIQLCQQFSVFYVLDDGWHPPYHLFNQILFPVNSHLRSVADNLIWQSCPTISIAICHLPPNIKKSQVILRIKTEWHDSASQDANC